MAMYSRRNVYTPMLVVCHFREISEAVFEAGRSLTKKTEQERKRSRNVYAPIELCLTNWQGQAVSGSRNEERGCCLWKLKCERESVCCLCKSKCV